MKRTVFVMMIILLLSKVTGFLRTITIASTFGAGYLSDVFHAAFMIPGLFISIIVTGINTSMIPVLSSAEIDGHKDRTFNRLLSLGLVVSIIVVLFIIAFAGVILSFTHMGYSPEKQALAAHYTRIMSVMTGMQILTYIFAGYLQQSNRFYIVAAIAIPMNFIIIAMTLLGSSETLIWVVIAHVIGYLSQLLMVAFPFIKEKFPFRFDIDLKDEYLPIFLSLVGPVVLTTSVGQLNVVVDQMLASLLPEGQLTILSDASKINGLFQSVLIMSFTTIMFTQQSKLVEKEEQKKLCEITQKNLSMILLLIVPIILGILFLHQEIFSVVFLRGKYTADDAYVGGRILFYYAFSLFGWSVNDVLGKFFYSTKEAKKTVWPSFIIIGSNIILNIILVRFMGVYGLALASSIAVFIGMMIFYRKARGRFDKENVPVFSQSVSKYFLAGGAMYGLLRLLREYTSFGRMSDYPMVFISAAVGATVYFLILFLLKTDELTMMKDLILRKLKRS